jgi:lipooligosaccharide transport system permease protein
VTATAATLAPRRPIALLPGWARPWKLVERNATAYRRLWYVFLLGFLDPVFYLLSIGVGVGELVGQLEGPGGRLVDYEQFVAPGMMAAAAMNGSVFDTTFNFFVKFKYAHTYESVLATPVGVRDLVVGEVAWALIRGSLYAVGFLGAMWALDLVPSLWGLLAIPGAILIGFAFAGAGLGCTTFMRAWTDFDFVNLVLIPSFLFSGTFFPLERYPDALAWLVRLTPLYQGVALERALVLGHLEWTLLLHVAYLLAMGAVGLRVADRRLSQMLQP